MEAIMIDSQDSAVAIFVRQVSARWQSTRRCAIFSIASSSWSNGTGS
jgi:hypothetical protein